MLQIQNLSKSFGDRVLFQNLQLALVSKERLGLLGRNGQGKSVLLKLIAGELSPDSGEIVTPKNYSIGYLHQHLHFTKQNIVDELMGELDSEEDYKAKEILSGLGFSVEDFTRPASSFSGGYQIRVQLGKVLIANPHCLLLDEPTNFLDIIAKRWFIQYIRRWPGELIIVSHERDFIDAVCTHCALLTPQGDLYHVPGNTTKLFDKIELDAQILAKTQENQEKKIKQTQLFIDRFRSKSSKATLVQSRIKALEKMEVVTQEDNVPTLDFHFRYLPIPAKVLLKVKNLSFGFNPNNLLFSDLSFDLKAKSVIGIIGQNGKGKSTLLNTIANELCATSGTIEFHPKVNVSYFGQTNVDRLNPQNTIYQEIELGNGSLSRGEIQTICGTMMFSGADALKKISVLSGGERARVLLGKILTTPTNVLLLDEPTNHLDMESIEALISAISEFEGSVILVSHHEELLHRVCDSFIIFDPTQNKTGVRYFLGSYEDFLNKIGWFSESQQAKVNTKNINIIDEKKQRAFYIAQRSLELKDLKKDFAKWEEQIAVLEKKKTELETKLLNAKSTTIAQDSIALSKVNGELDICNDKWLVIGEKIESIQEKYDKILN